MTDELNQLPPLREVIKTHGLSAQKSLGQNFLLDLNLTSKIARSAGPLENHTVIEVGPGPGGLTRSILQEGAEKLIVIEKDQRCVAALEAIANVSSKRLHIISEDALKIDMASLSHSPAKIIANLPYNVATPLLIDWLSQDDWPPFYTSLTLMVQREVADRITAEPGTKSYGRLSVISQWRADTKRLFDVPASAFTPPPKVTSSIIQIIPKEPILSGIKLSTLEALTAAAFGQRRKMLRASLKTFTRDPQTLLAKAGIKETKRAEEVDIAGFCQLALLSQD